MPPLLSPPKGERRIKGIGRFLPAALKNDRFSYLFIPDFFHIGSVIWEFIRYFGDIKATLYNGPALNALPKVPHPVVDISLSIYHQLDF